MTGEWITTDDLDADALEGDLFTMEIEDRETWDRITDGRLSGFSIAPDDTFSMDSSDLSLETPVLDAAVRQDQQRIEKAIRGAIRAGYDGVDINRPQLAAGFGDDRPLDSVVLLENIEPWHRPAPDGANGYRTERYTWDWFSEDDLTALLRADDPTEVIVDD